MNFWIFVVNADLNSEKLFENYMIRKKNFWTLKKSCANCNKIKKDDQIIFYLAGIDGKKFIGTAILDSAYKELDKSDYEQLAFFKSFDTKFGVYIKCIRLFTKPISIYPLLDSLTLTKGIKKWGFKFNRSILPLSNNDFLKIISSI